MRPAILYPSLAAGESFGKRRVTFPDVVRVSSDGCMIVLGGRTAMVICASACGVRRDMFAVVSGSAVVVKSGELV